MSGFFENLVLRAAGKLVAPFFQAIVGVELQAARALLAAVVAFILQPSPDAQIASGWFGNVAGQLAPVAKLIVFPLLFAATIGAVLRQDARRLGRIWLVGLPAAVITGAAAVTLTRYGLEATDALTSAVKAEIYPHFSLDLPSLIFGPTNLPSSMTTVFLYGLLTVLVMVGGVFIWLEMIVRTAAVEVAVFFMPLVLAGLVWPSTARWAKRLVEILVALLLMKPVVVGALCLGAHAVLGAGAGIGTIVTGGAIMLMAAFTPMALLKLVPVAEASAIGHLDGMGRQPFRSAQQAWDRAKSHLGAAAAASGGPAGAAAGGASQASQAGSQLLARVGAATSSGGNGQQHGRAGGPGSGSDDYRLGPAGFGGGGAPALGSGRDDARGSADGGTPS
ncbi:MAG TPA: hypothetical protein VFN61_16235 [Acidimicrobiales bacterium]|nr:hypothetical protein [Acidimicrobiales bacterium]